MVQVKKNKQPTVPWEGNSQERGNKAEAAFLKAWEENGEPYPSLIDKVRPATKKEDNYEKTDAVVTIAGGEDIRIQIKSGRIGKKRIVKFLKIGIAPLRIQSTDTVKQIRENTVKSILMLKDYLCKGTLPFKKGRVRKSKKEIKMQKMERRVEALDKLYNKHK